MGYWTTVLYAELTFRGKNNNPVTATETGDLRAHNFRSIYVKITVGKWILETTRSHKHVTNSGGIPPDI